jgi:ribosome maturation factor RimP
MRGFTKPLILVLINKNNMIDNNVIKTAVNEWLAKGDYYLVDVEMTDDDRIVIEIDHADGVWIEDCADLSRFLQEKLGEELGEYELEVGSAGIGQPFKVIEQYRNHVGKEVEVLAADGKKLQGVMKEVSEDGSQFTVTVKEKQQVEGKKRPVLVEVDKTFDVNAVKYCKYLLNFK